MINATVDPSGESVPVAREGDGARGETQEVAQCFPAPGDSGLVQHRGVALQLVFFDTPGFNDPDKRNDGLMRNLSRATVHMCEGIDAIVHVVKKGRMTEPDRQLPRLLLDGLAHDEESRAELAKRWMFIVTHADSGRQAVDEANIEQFRGAMMEFF